MKRSLAETYLTHPTFLKRICYYYINSIKCIKTIEENDRFVTCLTVWDNMLVNGNREGKIKIHKYEKLICEIYAHKNTVMSLLVWDNFLVSGSRDKTIKIWKYDKDEMMIEKVNEIKIKYDILSLCLWNDMLVIGDLSGCIKLFQFKDRLECIKKIHDYVSYVSCLCVWNGYLISGGDCDKNIKIWDTGNIELIEKNNQEIRMWKTQNEFIKILKETTWYATCFYVWDDMLVSGHRNGELRLCEREEIYHKEWKNINNIIKAHDSQIECLCEWNGLLVSGCSRGEIKLWNKKYECVKILRDHTGPVLCLIVWDRMLISGGCYGSIRFWE